ncbi:type VI secretion system membrane subunit TssM [Trinickia sp. YCB016]
MKKYLSLLATRQSLAVISLAAVALLIWFYGPSIAFGGVEPFASVGARVVMITLVFTGACLWLRGWSTGVVFIAFLCLLIWYAAPLLSFRHAEPFAPTSVRVIAVAIVLTVFVVYSIFRLWRKALNNERFVKKLLGYGAKKEQPHTAGQLEQVDDIFDSALGQLKKMRMGAGEVRRLFQRDRYLYEMPWYIALGAQASGKTSALLNAGLSFPLAQQMQQMVSGRAKGTKSVDWWFTNDTVLIDTAGRYTRNAGASKPEALARPLGAQAEHSSSGEYGGAHEAGDEPVSDQGTVAEPLETPSISRDTEKLSNNADAAEWRNVLALLRKHRPRAPINGALLLVDMAELVSEDENARSASAASLRERLGEMRTQLSIRFPVYLLITKMDQLPGFTEYFSPLTLEGRAQTWGFALPYGKETLIAANIRDYCRDEFRRLADRISDGVNARLQEEYDVLARRKLEVFPEEFSALTLRVNELVGRVFADSPYDDTQKYTTLRGVYFTSAAQTGDEHPAETRAIISNLETARGAQLPSRASNYVGNKGYFLHDLLTKQVLRDANLVRPNRRFEHRQRLLRTSGHLVASLLFTGLAAGLWISFDNNRAYLDSSTRKARLLAARVEQFYKEPKSDAIPDTLTDAQKLPAYPGLDLTAPPMSYRFGLYTLADFVAESQGLYDALEDNLLLPQIVHRQESVISQAIAQQDAKTAYDTLRVYLMLYDKQRFNADDVKAWVLNDWSKPDSAAAFGARASMLDHLQQLFSGARIVQSPLIRNDALIQQARAFLDASNATERLYERAKAAMQKEAPDEFTLLRAVSPQAGTVFTRASGSPLSRGVPGLFTFDGYRNLFDKRLPEFVQAARADDAWVMGRQYLDGGPEKTTGKRSNELLTNDPLTEAIRKQYLTEYAQRWDAFLADIRTIKGTSLEFSLKVLRDFAAPDSPLTRLARAAVHETTLTRSVAAPDDKPANPLSEKTGTPQPPSIRLIEPIERELVDNRFAALREVVTGSADTQDATQSAASQANKTGLDGISNLLNDYYTALTVADNALGNNSMPPASDTAAKLKMTANAMPTPFRAVLLDLAVQGSREVNRGIGQLLSRQMEAVIGDTCRLVVDGNYPFAADGKREIGNADFTRLFAQGGVIDDFFTKTLAPFVDTSARPWRYKTLPGATEPVQGPDLEPFQHAKAIRDVFFADAGQKQQTWKAEIRVPELDPNVTSLVIDIDGQTLLYQHGPVVPLMASWPGPRGGVHAVISASPRIRPETSAVEADGPWALMRLLRKGHIVDSTVPGRTRVAFDFDGRTAVLDIASPGSVANPLTSDVLTSFKCPSAMPTFGLIDTGPPPGLPPGLPGGGA